jgi:phosphatidylinositol alpha-1,6-mannosyltransferase
MREWRAFRWLRRNAKKAKDHRSGTVCGVWYPEGLIAYVCGVQPLVILAHGSELLPPKERWRRPLWSALQRRVLESASLVIANSEYTSNLVAGVAAKARVTAIPLAVDTDRFAPGDREFAKAKFGVVGKRVICTVSRIHRYKGHDIVLRAIASLAKVDREELMYLVAGDGPHAQELRQLAVDLGIDSHVCWLGFISEQELPLVYHASDLFVLCTRDVPEERAVEGFGLVFLEAQSCGTPVVGTRTGGIAAAIREGEGGWLIDQDDTKTLANMIRELIHSPQSYCDAGQQARRRMLRECTWASYGQRLAVALREAEAFAR